MYIWRNALSLSFKRGSKSLKEVIVKEIELSNKIGPERGKEMNLLEMVRYGLWQSL